MLLQARPSSGQYPPQGQYLCQSQYSTPLKDNLLHLHLRLPTACGAAGVAAGRVGGAMLVHEGEKLRTQNPLLPPSPSSAHGKTEYHIAGQSTDALGHPLIKNGGICKSSDVASLPPG
jgi:hypothetical protein